MHLKCGKYFTHNNLGYFQLLLFTDQLLISGGKRVKFVRIDNSPSF